ncbi:YdcF family protein [Parasphingorhabdus pacifica]
MAAQVPKAHRADAEILWSYLNLRHRLRACDVGVVLGSHDLGVATFAAELHHRGIAPRLLLTGANAPTTIDRFPRGEAVHYREHLLESGVPDEAILVEPSATNTGENIRFARALLASCGVRVRSVLLICLPYQQRRAFATCRKLWPEVDVVCASSPLPLDEYVAALGEPERVVNMLVGEAQRISLYADRAFVVPQPVPEHVRDAYRRLASAGYTRRLLPA